MNKLERRLVKIALQEAYGPDWGNSAYFFSELNECYKRYSDAKYRADMHNKDAFKKEVIEVLSKYTNKTVYKNHYILSYNRNFFTTLQIAYFFSDDAETIYLGHNLNVIEQYSSLKELNKYFQFCKDYNEY